MNAFRALVVPLLAAVSLVAVGCASPPEVEKKAAETAVSAAKSAGADRYAASDYAAMNDALKAAESEMSAKKYTEAKASYEKVKALAEKAAAAAGSGKSAMKVEVEKQVGDLEKRWQALEGKAKATAKKLKAEQKKAWDAGTKSVTEGLQAVKGAVGDDPAGAKDKLSAVTAAMDKWEAELAAMAKPAGKEAKKPEAKKKP